MNNEKTSSKREIEETDGGSTFGDLTDEDNVQILIAGYHASLEQNKLYAEFRWKVFSYISTLQAGLFLLVVNLGSAPLRIVCSFVGVVVSLVLWMLERRHHELFTQSRNSAKKFENALGLESLGVFNNQITQKRGLGHSRLVLIITLLTVIMWSFSFLFNSKVFSITAFDDPTEEGDKDTLR